MVTMCPDFYNVTYQRERIVRVSHIGGKFRVIGETPFGNGEIELNDPAEFASFCSSIHVERAFGGNVYGGIVGIEEWLTFGSVE